jgi:hypothetical protein
MKNHHVPQFLLAGWCGKDGRLVVYTRRRERIAFDWHTPEHTGFEIDLYAVSALPEKDRHWVEREIMTKNVDGPASAVLKQLLAGELRKLDSDGRSAWARFMMAQWLRTPEMIAKLRRDGRTVMVQHLEANPEEYREAFADSPHATPVEWVDANVPDLDEIVSMTQVLPALLNHADAGQSIVSMNWEVLDLSASKIDLLTSDCPVLRFESIDSRNCLIAVPLDPRRLFVASHYDRGFRRLPAEKIARAANVSTVQHARARAYSSGVQHGALVEKYLGRSTQSSESN